ncbi:hypothetical protein MCC10074_1595 [Bifidobacterium longum subsp. longum]|uniref:hypothetical protein n=1 Tax=Bifidobacterium longum TaxID=216816 RepID=UPI0010E5BA6A|nr:hypothetical protein [Bifidobacterium longum]TCE90886.1 hypothetical protein MCC10074_1595 [Bifidobacterium longum subsp. longum]
MRFKWEFVSQQVDQRRDSLDYALEYLLKRESSINPFGVEVDRLPSGAGALFNMLFLP